MPVQNWVEKLKKKWVVGYGHLSLFIASIWNSVRSLLCDYVPLFCCSIAESKATYNHCPGVNWSSISILVHLMDNIQNYKDD